MPSLVITLPGGIEEAHELTDPTITVGRHPDSGIQINDVSVSGHHAELTLKGAHYHIRDLDSTNGIRIGGKTLEEADLEPGVHVRFGKVDAVYSPRAPREAQPMPEGEPGAAAPAAESSRPADFANASPFKTKGKDKDSAGRAMMGLAIFSMIVFLGAVATILTLKPPQ